MNIDVYYLTILPLDIDVCYLTILPLDIEDWLDYRIGGHYSPAPPKQAMANQIIFFNSIYFWFDKH